MGAPGSLRYSNPTFLIAWNLGSGLTLSNLGSTLSQAIIGKRCWRAFSSQPKHYPSPKAKIIKGNGGRRPGLSDMLCNAPGFPALSANLHITV
jgi:hypothetical protein